jgi:hypothetical protein
MQIFVRTLTNKTITIAIEPSATVSALKKLVREKEGIPEDQQRLTYGIKPLEDDSNLIDYGIHEGSTLSLLLRMRGGGFPTPGVLRAIMCGDLSLTVASAPHTQDTCKICLTDDTLSVTVCCAKLCDECLVRYLQVHDFSLSCIVCKMHLNVGTVLASPVFQAFVTAKEEIEALMKHIDVQLCTCGALLLNETMYAKQRCTHCQRELCFFCNQDWAGSMVNQRFMCRPDCEYAKRIVFEQKPLLMGAQNVKVPDRRMCPKCFHLGAYDEKCKYHVCPDCKHEFCFICLKDKATCSKTSTYNTGCSVPLQRQTMTDFPRLLKQ